jgi:hypothetical protein
VDEKIKHDCPGEDPYNNIAQIPDAGVAPEALIESKRDERYPSNDHHPRKHLYEQCKFTLWNQSVKPEPEG